MAKLHELHEQHTPGDQNERQDSFTTNIIHSHQIIEGLVTTEILTVA
jgi:hypothetical protein